MNKNRSLELFKFSANGRTGVSEEVPAIESIKGRLIVDWPTGTTAGDAVLEAAPISGYANSWLEVGRVTYVSGAPKLQQTAILSLVDIMLRVRWATDHAGGANAARVFLVLQSN